MAKRFTLGVNGWLDFETSGRLPKVETLNQLAELGFSMDWLVTGNGSMLVDPTPSVKTDLQQSTGTPQAPTISELSEPDRALLLESIEMALEIFDNLQVPITNRKKSKAALLLFDRRKAQGDVTLTEQERAELLTEKSPKPRKNPVEHAERR